MKTAIIFIALLFIASISTLSAQEQNSKLWGKNGELWNPEGRLPDFSYAGYHSGEEPIPNIKAVTSVKKFGAKGDGKTDDTVAFQKAIAATEKGAILIPEGRYILSSMLEIKKPNIVLRGAGMDKTVLFFSKPLEEIIPKASHTTTGKVTSAYSWSGGVIWVKGFIHSKQLAVITENSKRGSFTVKVKDTGKLKPGDRIKITQKDSANQALCSYLYQGDSGKITKVGKISIDMAAVIKKISRDGTVTLNRPLKFDIRKEWSPVISEFKPSVSEVGIENMTIEFPLTPYKGHFKEQGYNAIAFTNISDSWVRNVRIINADSGFFIHSYFCTLENIIFDSKREEATKNCTGHHGVSLWQDCLLQNFRFNTSFIHDITVGYLSSGNVCSNGYGKILSLDHHRKAPFSNLFTNLDAGTGRDIWRCGGGNSLGKHAAAWNTFWNIRAENLMKYPNPGFGCKMINVVGLYTKAKSVTEPNGQWFESIPPKELRPQNLYEAQLKKRLNSTRHTSRR